ncbi:glutathione S-transferase family protein [Achromobacter aloeverae]|uniref:Glutathione S-transferase n=1 Tax=Achromobacter aloeverae TaxID=1750518 RepID=A0A4Q1HEC5_9BURK|nr:glutathione S-transferase [Achromobacter aloeverae]RXN83643.1 glutathione S-transferase [Achromobacter aloeverae]
MIKIWGRVNSVNVQKVLWCCDELGLPYERIDAGLQFGRNNEPGYLAMNPNGRVPTLEDGDFSLWESNSILRYLVMQYGGAGHPGSGRPAAGHDLYPAEPRLRASIDRWLDWTLSTLQPAERSVFWGMVRTPAAERDMPAIQKAADACGKLWQMLDAHLEGREFAEGKAFSIADIVLGAYCRRYLGLDGIERPALPRVQKWYEGLQRRPAFQRHVAPALT